MSKKILLQLVIILSMLFPSFVLAQTHEIKNYTVKKGDTLWSISRSELGNAFLWPKVWKENTEISNPDRLYPGQIVKIPIYLKQKVLEERPTIKPAEKKMPGKKVKKAKKEVVAKRKPVRIPLKPLADATLLLTSGYISDSIPSVGMVGGSPSGRTLFGIDDTVFLKTDNAVKVGDKFIVIKAVQLKRPKAMWNKGYIIEPIGVVEVTRIEGGDIRARITMSSGSINNRDLLDTYHKVTPPLTTGKFRKPDITGQVIAARNLRLLNSLFDIVYLDKGMKDGLEVGDMFRTVDTSSGHTVSSGIIQVIGARDTTSTAVIRGNTGEPVSAGNLFVQLK